MQYRTTSHAAVFAVTVFLSAFLLFQVQPLIGKYILPWFGGSPTVWTVCMLFFQTLLFGGYAYAHLTTHFVSLKPQMILHVGLLVAAVCLLPITPGEDWKPTDGGDPTWRIVVLLGACIGMPYFILSSTGPLLQAWFSRAYPDRSPYRLYALSNLGSLIALISYPFLFDPRFGADRQTVIWSFVFGGFAFCCGTCVWQTWRIGAGGDSDPQRAAGDLDTDKTRPAWSDGALWFALAMVPSMMLLATTNQICTDLAVVPFLWVLPLTLYLFSFILCFHSRRWCPRTWWSIAWAVLLAITVPVMFKGRGATTAVSVPAQITVYSSLLFCCAMVCHGELVRLKPHPAYLTSFYLTLAAGGAAGGVFVGIVAPLVFPTYVELSLAMVGCTALMLVVFYHDRSWVLHGGRPRWVWLSLLCATLALAGALTFLFYHSIVGVEAVHRNFYGVTRVKLEPVDPASNDYVYQLLHGRTLHGQQFTREDKRMLPTSYYSERSGVGLLLRNHRRGQSKRVGVVGLGVGTLAVYAEKGDYFRFYEINPAVIHLANSFFEYLSQCRSELDVIPGDGRISLENEPPQGFDVLVLDAFSSDAIPIHLLTQEAFDVYLQHLKPDGVLAVHVSNIHVDLRPVVAAHAAHFGLVMVTTKAPADEQQGASRAIWTLLSHQAATLQVEAIQKTTVEPERRMILWTDKRNSLFEALIGIEILK